MEYLFVYGTLVDPELLRSIIGRTVTGIPDKLYGYQYKDDALIIDGEKYPGIKECNGLSVEGVIYDVCPEELTLLDQYESGKYQRKRVRLESDINAFVYIPMHID